MSERKPRPRSQAWLDGEDPLVYRQKLNADLHVSDLQFQQRKTELGTEETKTDLAALKRKIQEAMEGKVKDDFDLTELNS